MGSDAMTIVLWMDLWTCLTMTAAVSDSPFQSDFVLSLCWSCEIAQVLVRDSTVVHWSDASMLAWCSAAMTLRNHLMAWATVMMCTVAVDGMTIVWRRDSHHPKYRHVYSHPAACWRGCLIVWALPLIPSSAWCLTTVHELYCHDCRADDRWSWAEIDGEAVRMGSNCQLFDPFHLISYRRQCRRSLMTQHFRCEHSRWLLSNQLLSYSREHPVPPRGMSAAWINSVDGGCVVKTISRLAMLGHSLCFADTWTDPFRCRARVSAAFEETVFRTFAAVVTVFS